MASPLDELTEPTTWYLLNKPDPPLVFEEVYGFLMSRQTYDHLASMKVVQQAPPGAEAGAAGLR